MMREQLRMDSNAAGRRTCFVCFSIELTIANKYAAEHGLEDHEVNSVLSDCQGTRNPCSLYFREVGQKELKFEK